MGTGLRSRKTPGLSKSRVMYGLQCQKRLYLHTHHPHLATAPTAVQQAIFDQGTLIGLYAQKQFPDGILIEEGPDATAKAIAKTEEAIRSGASTIFEAAFRHGGVLVRVDILHRNPREKSWEIIEVKSSTSVKQQYLDDVAVQTWVARGAGIKINRSSVMVINNQCVYPEFDQLFVTEDVTQKIEDRIKDIPASLKTLLDMLKCSDSPEIDIGPHCTSPYACPYIDHCWKARNISSPSIFEIPGVGKKAWDYYKQGIVSLTDPRLTDLSGKKGRAIQVARQGIRWIDPYAIMNGIKSWKWPLYFLDFETIGPAIPRFEGTRPFQQIPFQLSCHIQDKPGSPLRHAEYMHMDSSDPRLCVAEELLKIIGDRGNVVAYSMSMEKSFIEHLADACPAIALQLRAIFPRLVDPLPIIRNGVYDIGFRGSFSIKTVAPALLGAEMNYESLDIGEGQEAQIAFEEMISENTSERRREEIRVAMLKYCAQDTLAMAKVVEWLFKQVGE